MNLQGKTVLVTGAAKRIGREIALHFAQKGANVLIHYYRSLKEARSLVSEIKSLGVKSKAYRANLTSSKETKRLAQKILRDFPSIDVVVHNASTFYPMPFEKISEKDWDDFLSLHLKAPFLLTRALAPVLKKRKGVVIFIADRFSGNPRKNFLAYQVSKEAMLALMKQLAFTLAPDIRMGAVCPGFVLPPAYLSQRAQKRLAKENLLKKWGDQENIAKVVTSLAEQDFMPGEIRYV